MSYKNLEQQQQALEAAKYENAKRLTRVHVYQKYQRVVPCDANDKRISDICNRWLGGNPDVLHSLAIFEEACAANPTEFNSLAKQLETITCEQLIDQIISLLATKGKAHDDFTLRSERTRSVCSQQRARPTTTSLSVPNALACCLSPSRCCVHAFSI